MKGDEEAQRALQVLARRGITLPPNEQDAVIAQIASPLLAMAINIDSNIGKNLTQSRLRARTIDALNAANSILVLVKLMRESPEEWEKESHAAAKYLAENN